MLAAAYRTRYTLLRMSPCPHTAVASCVLKHAPISGLHPHNQNPRQQFLFWFGALLVFTCTLTFARAQVRLNEILANNTTIVNATNGTLTGLVELYNTSGSPVDVSGWSLSDSNLFPQRYIFPTNSIIPAGGFHVINFDSQFTNHPPSWTKVPFGIKASGGYLFMYDPFFNLIDATEFGLQLENFSIGRDGGGNWVLTTPTLGSANVVVPMGDVGTLKINEWLADQSGSGPDDYFEIYNGTNKPVALSSLFLTYTTNNPIKYQIAYLSFIGTGALAYVRFVADNASDRYPADHVNFDLSSDGQDSIILYRSDGFTQIDNVFIASGQLADVSEGRFPDGNPGTSYVRFPNGTRSPGAPNFLVFTNGVLTGRVISAFGIVVGAPVQLEGLGKSAVTDSNGRFSIAGVKPGQGYVLTVSAAGFAVQRFPNIDIAVGPNDLGDLFLGNPSNLPAQLRPLVPDVNPNVTTIEEGGTAYRYYQVLATDGRTLVGGVTVGLRRAGGTVVPQAGDISSEWAGAETGKPDGDGLVRLRLPSSAIGNAGSTATFEVLLGAAVVQTFTATVQSRAYDQVWKHKWSLGGLPYGAIRFGQSHETRIIRKFGGSDNGIEIVGRERDEEFKVGGKLEYGSRIGRTGANVAVGIDGGLTVGLGQSFRFSPDTTDVLDNLLKLDAAFADNLNLVPVGGIVLEGIRQELLGFVSADRIESTDTALKFFGHVNAEAGFGLAWPLSDDLAIYANGELAADVAAEIGAMNHPGRYFDSYIEFSGNVKLEYDAKNTFGTPVFFQPGGSVKGTVRRDADGHHPRKLILESKLSVTTDSARTIPGWNENDILDLQPLEKAEYRNQYTLRLPGLNDSLPIAQNAWNSIDQRGQGTVLKISQPVAWLSSVLGAGEPVAYEKSIYSAETTVASSPILESLPVIEIKLTGEKGKGAVVRTEAGLLWKNRRVALEKYPDKPSEHYPSQDIFALERQWLGHAAAPVSGFVNRAVHAIVQAGETVIEVGRNGAMTILRFGQGVMSSTAQVTTKWYRRFTGSGQLVPHAVGKSISSQPLGSLPPEEYASNYIYGVSGVYQFESTNEFSGSATLEIPYSDEEIAGLNEEDLQIYHLPAGTNRWRLVDGVVNALSNTLTATITNLGTFAIAPPLPSGDLILSVASNTLPADGVATSIITVSNLMLNNGQIATQLWLYTVSASGVEIMDSDVTTNYSGVQLVSTNGALSFTVRAPLGGNSAKVSVASLAGDAAGELAINLVDNAPPLAPSGVTVSAGKSRLFVSWQTNAETDLAGYRVYYRAGIAEPPWNGTAAVEGSPSPVAVAGTNVTLRGLASDTNYFIALVAVDATGNESLPTIVGPLTLTNTPPQPPTSVAVSFGADGINFLSWALSEDDGYNDRDVAHYDIYHAVFPGGAFVKIGEAPAGVGLFSETNALVGASNYLRYAVIAVATNGESSAEALANRFLASGAGIDNDGDGMADDWESGHGLNSQDPTDGAADPDQDGLSNLEEFLRGRNPTVFDNLRFSSIQPLPDGTFQLSVNGEVGRNYSILISTNLLNWMSLTNFVPTNATTYVIDTGATNFTQRFYRVVTP